MVVVFDSRLPAEPVYGEAGQRNATGSSQVLMCSPPSPPLRQTYVRLLIALTAASAADADASFQHQRRAFTLGRIVDSRAIWFLRETHGNDGGGGRRFFFFFWGMVLVMLILRKATLFVWAFCSAEEAPLAFLVPTADSGQKPWSQSQSPPQPGPSLASLTCCTASLAHYLPHYVTPPTPTPFRPSARPGGGTEHSRLPIRGCTAMI